MQGNSKQDPKQTHSTEEHLGSIDRTISQLQVGYHQGLEEGYQKGYLEGEQQGYQNGYSDGEQNGWNNAVREANQEINKQLAFTRQYLSESEELKTENTKLLNLLQNKTKQYNDCLVLRNQTAIFANVAREVLEQMMEEASPPAAARIKKRFSQTYKSHSTLALSKHYINQRLEKDASFAQEMPQTLLFLLAALEFDEDELDNDM